MEMNLEEMNLLEVMETEGDSFGSSLYFHISDNEGNEVYLKALPVGEYRPSQFDTIAFNLDEMIESFHG